jgi:hypothetical protein
MSPHAADQRESRRSRGAIWAAIARHRIVSPRCSSPSRGVAPTTTPDQRPRISQPSVWTSTPVSSSRHSCHRSSGCTMPTRAASRGRAPASRRAAIRISAGVRTLTTTAWAQAALDDRRGAGRPPKCGAARQTATPVGEPCAMARTATLSARNRGRTIRVEPAHIDGKPVTLSPLFPACGTW